MEKAERGGGASGMGGAATSSTNGCNHSHTASQLHCRACTHRVGQRGRGSEGVGVSITCVQITRCARCAPTTQITHPLCHSSMQMACESAERKKRGGQLIHSLPPPPHIQLAHTTLHLLSFPPSPSISLSSTPAIHAHTITSTDLSDNHQHTTAPLTHTHTRPKPHPLHVPVHKGNTAAAAVAAPLLAFLATTTSPYPPPPACNTCKHKQQVVHV